jgi:hypothetical protein
MRFRKVAPTKRDWHIIARYIGERRSWQPAYEIHHLKLEYHGYRYIVNLYFSMKGFHSLAEAKAWVSENQE